ncbi:MAG: septum formation initiator family protein [Candidatus Paceibacterota bacterium]|jgi:cell division protein FtsB
MFDYQQKKKIRKVIYSKITLVVLFIFIIILAKANYGIFKKERLSRENYNIVKDDFDSLKGRKVVLESEISRLKTSEGVEEEIRSKFDVSKPGEVVVNIIDSGSSTSIEGEEVGVGFWNKIINWFK